MKEAERGYYRFPTINGDRVVFVCEDDLWLLELNEDRAHRLTAGLAEASHPAFSPDGSQVALVGKDEGPTEVFVLPVDGGASRRLTWHGARTVYPSWKPDGSAIVYATNAGQPFLALLWLHEIKPEGGLPQRLPWGAGARAAFAPHGGVVLGRHGNEPAYWKRYRGGTAGQLWVDAKGDGEFIHLVQLQGNLSSANWVGDRVFFLSDHDGVGNVYSCLADGSDLRRHTEHEDYYARNLSGDGTRLVYHAGAVLYLLDPRSGENRRLEFQLGSSRTQRNRKYAPAGRTLDSAVLNQDSSRLAITTRGKAFAFANWEGAVSQLGTPDGVRHRDVAWLGDETELVAVTSDDGPVEELTVLRADGAEAPRRLAGLDVGRVVELLAVPGTKRVVLTNHRGELVTVDLGRDQAEARVLDRCEHGLIRGLAIAPDRRWVAYEFWTSSEVCAIKVCELETGETNYVTRPALVDRAPAFDPAGRYLYFIGYRDFDPVYDGLHFDLSFTFGARPYAITLRRDLPSPFIAQPRAVAPEKPAEPARAPERLEIDFEGIADRVRPFPVPEGRYARVAGTADLALFTSLPVEGAARRPIMDDVPEGKAKLQAYSFATQKVETFLDGISDFKPAPDGRTLLVQAGDRLRVLKAAEKGPELPPGAGDKPGRQSGWIDLDRVKVSVRPAAEWRQMLREAWRLQRENFWTEDLSGIDWDAAYALYAPLVDRVTTRSEFSDLVWELQGELGTSHAYEIGGDHRRGPDYKQGSLGAQLEFDAGAGVYRIVEIAHGDPWDESATSPLLAPGIDVRPGDAVLAINGQPLDAETTPGERLTNLAGSDVVLTVRRGSAAPTTVTVKALADERPARYRDWVDAKRAAVHAATDGRVGYLHIPGMMAAGFGEFHRGYLNEYDRDALIVDVRYNSGGHVSSLLLEKLARRRIGYSFPRRFDPSPYPQQSVAGPLVAITNENAGSDGDIFSHAFKQMRLGTLVGKRTWGGVVGISPRQRLADGSITTQPEHSFYFDDVGWGVENHGTDPDVEVDYRPQDYARGVDPQLEKAIELALAALSEHPPHRPRPTERPDLSRRQSAAAELER
ncbi:MAG TPA: LpqB family beta-propeller domain-containing protein [Candidatus Dormibacteraeota bacterium]